MSSNKIKIPSHRRPTTVGEILTEDYMRPLGLTQQQFAEALGIDRPGLNAIVNGRRRVTVEMAMRLARVLRTSTAFWLNLQMMTDLYEAQRSPAGKKISKLPQLAAR
jgi:addiction module HigA family antidote